MLGKDLRRGERRWRSQCVWMRRLKGDWATHGRQYNISPVYEWKDGVKGRLVGWRDDLCKCFNLTNREAYRFKDTPTWKESRAAFRKSDGWHDQRIWEERNASFSDEVPESAWGKSRRDRREGTHPERVCCRRCGYFLKMIKVKNGSWCAEKWAVLCEGCTQRQKRSRAAEAA